ncbi:MAG: GIY-YIG nuclease family protein [Vulcanisaeta sp.]|jgi:Uri superfamily endonuclease|uniref:GIY-YIG nuclease family protein n=1 Tax=Vulcanisaeta sp. TaxID=2020871 RepID=UPI003D0E57D8
MVKALSYVALFKCRGGYVITRGRKFAIGNGLYAYVGSCGNACAARIVRHLGKVVNRFWHVDYLHDICNEVAVMVLPFKEEDVAKALLSRFPGIPGFGNSDKKEDKTHLFMLGSESEGVINVLNVLSRMIHEN